VSINMCCTGAAIALQTLVLAACLHGQISDFPLPRAFGGGVGLGPPVEGEIRGFNGNIAGLAVLLCDVSTARQIQESEVQGDGTFRFSNVPAGAYVIKLVRPPDRILAEQTVQISAVGGVIRLDVPNTPKPSPAATISAERLQHPLSPKGAKLIGKAQEYAHAGEHLKAIEELHRALKEASAIPYAHSILGVEYLRTGQLAAATGELEQAVQLLPQDAANHSNLAYALFLGKDNDAAEREVRRALELDRSNSPAQRLLGYILKAREK
jgi:tetratricopeptide (TPR) repeat protein